jgi:hypothetical protein
MRRLPCKGGAGETKRDGRGYERGHCPIVERRQRPRWRPAQSVYKPGLWITPERRPKGRLGLELDGCQYFRPSSARAGFSPPAAAPFGTRSAAGSGAAPRPPAAATPRGCGTPNTSWRRQSLYLVAAALPVVRPPSSSVHRRLQPTAALGAIATDPSRFQPRNVVPRLRTGCRHYGRAQ